MPGGEWNGFSNVGQEAPFVDSFGSQQAGTLNSTSNVSTVSPKGVHRAWVAPLLVVPAVMIAGWASTTWLVCDREINAILTIGLALLIAHAAMLLPRGATPVRSQARFVIATCVLFMGAAFGVFYAMTAARSRFFAGVTGYPLEGLECAAAGAAVALVGSAILCRHLFPSTTKTTTTTTATTDAHHPAMVRAAVLCFGASAVCAVHLTSTRFFFVPPIGIAFGGLVLALVARADLGFERRLKEIVDGGNPRYDVIPAPKGASELPRLARWISAIEAPEHGFIVEKIEASSYREAGDREKPIASIAIGRGERVPRVMLVWTFGMLFTSVVGLIAVFATAPMISTPRAVRELHGESTTSYFLRDRSSFSDMKIPNVTFYMVRNIKAGTYSLHDVAYDASEKRVLSSKELWLRMPDKERDLSMTAAHAITLFVDATGEAVIVLEDPPEIIGRDLYFTSARWTMRGRSLHGSRCMVGLDTGVLKEPCEDRAVPPYEPMRTRAAPTGY